MEGGIIGGNTGKYSGGGVFISSDSNFSKTGGAVIYGYSAGDANSNKAVYDSGAVTTDGGHAVYVNNSARGNPRRNDTTADGLSYTGADNPASATYTGSWTTNP
jgi:hypothetical protein